jgi:predicted Rossmann fold flavoprotein
MMKQFDVIIIGGGTSGMMAAISAASLGAKTLIIEKNKMIGKKLLATGGGRCNVTNKRDVKDLIAHIPGNGKFLYSAFNEFDNYDIIEFFESRGVALKEEDHGRMFPITDSSKTIVDALTKEIKDLDVSLKYQKTVKSISYQNKQVVGVVLEDGEVLDAKAVIIACGGRAAPITGSSGDGYKWAKKAGHTIERLYPTEVPILSNESFIKDGTLMGLSLRDVALSVLNKKEKEVVKHQMDVIFTHFGVSGPAALRCSMFVHQVMNKEQVDKVPMKLDVLPSLESTQLLSTLQSLQRDEGNKSVKNVLKTMIPERYAVFLLDQLKIDLKTAIKSLHKNQLADITNSIKNFRFFVHGTQPIEKAFVTGGGVSIKEVYPKTMGSKLMNGLYFAGEILDINGYTGGFNITAAFVTGYVAGYNAAMQCFEIDS